MEVSKQRLEQLLETVKWSSEDRRWLLEYLESDDTSLLQQIMQEKFKENSGNGIILKDGSAEKLLQLIHDKIKSSSPAKIIPGQFWKRVAAAAAIIIVLGAGAYLLFSNKGKKEIAKTNNNAPQKIDLPPGGNKAVLTLADNRTIVLDNAQNGTIAEQGNTKVVKLVDGQISYDEAGQTQAVVLYNTITTPRGGQYQLTLSDGSKVWLNAASSIRFPTAFIGSDRKVEITGEAYFEIEHDATKSFHVTVNGMDVQDLGTHFNINAYNDEAEMKTTLLEGEVKVTKGNAVVFLTPGSQAEVKNDEIKLVKNVDLNQVIAWQKGMFEFEHLELPVIMRQISRWYDVDISYEGNIPTATFGGGISKNLPLSSVMESLRSAGIHLRLEGKKLIVTP